MRVVRKLERRNVVASFELGVLVAPNNLPAQAFYRSLNFQRVIRNGEYAGHGEYWNLTLTTA
jgi:ribosomal protein S18 acetylase RimI-like enzyme